MSEGIRETEKVGNRRQIRKEEAYRSRHECYILGRKNGC